MIGPILKNGLRLNLTGEIISRPYINLTLQLMKEFGADAAWSSESSITVRPSKYKDIPFTVESDWSGASYWYQMVALILDNEKEESTKTEIKLPGLLPRSHQGDSRGAEIFAKSGISTKSSFKQATGVPILVSTTPWPVYVVCTPSLANISL